MSILSRNKKTDIAKKENKKVPEAKQAKGDFKRSRMSKEKAGMIVLEPIISEKSSLASPMNKYIFKVALFGNKNEVKKAVESLYNVIVKDVNILKTAEKPKRIGREIVRKSGFKKAIVTLKEGETISEIKN